MCGICGAVGWDLMGQAAVQKMLEAMIHRGPDSVGYLDTEDFSLGVRRLGIIDLRTGDQPIFNEAQSVAAILNGEIYNFADLRHKLTQKGHHFSTQSDTEVIVHAYEEWHTECVTYLRGMFSFAVLDWRNPQDVHFFLARDRLGIKPLYLWQDSDKLLFASEVRALLASGLVPKKLSVAGLTTYLAFGSVQEPLTMIEGVSSLPPAGWMRIRADSGGRHISQGKYWQPAELDPNEQNVHEVSKSVEDAVISHLVSDVPLGVFLSGGLDSGAIVSIASTAMQDKREALRAFTLGFEDWRFDEQKMAGDTASKWGIDLKVRVLSHQQVLSELDFVLAALDQPTVDGINTWYVAREARQVGLKVALSGVGGDELFAGYPSFNLVRRLWKLPRQLTKVGGQALRFVPSSIKSKNPDRFQKLSAYLAGDPFYPHPYFSVRGLLTFQQINQVLLPQMLKAAFDSDEMSAWYRTIHQNMNVASHFDNIGEISWLEISHYMLSTLLRDTDVMGMAHSLEIRVPFADHRLVEQILPLPGRLKVVRNQPKSMLVNALHGEIMDTPVSSPKRTFTLPFEQWLRQGLHAEVDRRMKDPLCLAKWFDLVQVNEVWKNFEMGKTNWARPWMLYVLDRWIAQNL